MNETPTGVAPYRRMRRNIVKRVRWTLKDEAVFGEQVPITICQGRDEVAAVANRQWHSPGSPVTDPEVWRRAHLIKAAPQMRDALREAERFIQEIHVDEQTDGMASLLRLISDALDAAEDNGVYR